MICENYDGGEIIPERAQLLGNMSYHIFESQFGFSAEPNIKVTSAKFKNMIIKINKTGSTSIRITQCKNGITWCGIGPDGVIVFVDRWRDICEIFPSTPRSLDDVTNDNMLETVLDSAAVSCTEKEDFKVELIVQTMRPFTKYPVLNNADIIKIFMGKDAIKFEGAIDACGSMTTIVRSNVPT